MRIVSLALSMVLTACSTTVKGPADASDVRDAGEGVVDAGVADSGESVDAGSEDAGEADAGKVTDAGYEDAGSADAATPVDAGSATAPGQCSSNADCKSGTCTVRPPGGFCADCQSDSDCPGPRNGLTYTCNGFGTCNQDCDVDADCPIGLRCHSTQHVCVLKSCGSCPSPYVCENGYCSRPPCDANCPAGKCRGAYCIVEE